MERKKYGGQMGGGEIYTVEKLSDYWCVNNKIQENGLYMKYNQLITERNIHEEAQTKMEQFDINYMYER